MVDNVAITAGTGTSIASDDIAGVQYQRMKVAWGVDGAAVDSSDADPFPVKIKQTGIVSTTNSTTANLAAAAVFTGTSEEVSGYSNISVSVFSSHASATDGLSIQQSSDGTNWDLLDAYSIPAATGKVFSFGVAAKFYRLVYTNGATLTTSLRIQTLFSTVAKRGSSIRPQDSRTNDNDFEEVATYLNMFNGTTWDRVRGKIEIGMDVALSGFNPTYRLFIPKGASGASKVYFDLFNATGSGKKVKILSVVPIVSGEVAVTGVVAVDLFLTRTTAVGTTGTAATNDATSLTAASITRMDTADAVVPAGITARLAPGGGATAGAVVSMQSVYTEETNAGSYLAGLQDFIRRIAGAGTPGLVVPENTGIRMVQGGIASVGNIGFDVVFETF